MRLILKKYKVQLILFFCFCLFILAYLVLVWRKENIVMAELPKPPDIIKSDYRLEDNTGLYRDEDRFKVYDVYLTVYKGLDSKSGQEFSLEDLNKIVGFENDPQLKTSVYVKDSITQEIVAGSYSDEINSTVELRGQSARRSAQKSYKIRLSRSSRYFQGQKELNLNLHEQDDTRMMQKFTFDSMIGLESFASFRTNFMNLYIKDGTREDSEYENYGLYTHVENADDDYLRVRGMDEQAIFYKPIDFTFTKEEIQSIKDGEPEESYLRSINRTDIHKVFDMVEGINEETIDFDAVFDTYFNRDNYLTWMAVNLLFNNYDTMSRNYLLYSPSNLNHWYFLPWDYDASLQPKEEWESSEYAKWTGLQKYWGVPLHRKFFQNPANVNALDERVAEVYQHIKSSALQTTTEIYQDIYKKYVIEPSIELKQFSKVETIEPEKVLEYIGKLENTLDYYYESYVSRKEAPMPFFMDELKKNDAGISMNWQDAYDLQNDVISYEARIFTNPEDIENSTVFVDESTASSLNALELQLPDGVYYWQVIAIDSQGNRQISFDRCELEPGYRKRIMFGMKKFYVVNEEIKEEAP